MTSEEHEGLLDISATGGNVWALIAAAGSGDRLGIDRPKAFAALGGRPLLAESIERLEACEVVDAIVVAAPPGWEEPAILLSEELAASKVVACVTGGDSRAASVAAALAEVPEDAVVIVVHDAARPLVDDAVVERVLEPLDEGSTARFLASRSPTRSSAFTRTRSPRPSIAPISSSRRRLRRFSHPPSGAPSKPIWRVRRTAPPSSSAQGAASPSSRATSD